MKRKKQLSILCFIAVMMLLYSSCKDSDGSKTDYDPTKPVLITNIEPEAGGLATKVFISGSNFGTDVSKIKVYFGETPAPVISSSGEYLYVFSPRQQDGSRHISVVVENDSTVFEDKTFTYTVNFIVRTVTGKKGTTQFKAGKLTEAEFHQPSTLVADQNGNLFLSHWRVPFCLVRINEKEDIVEAVLPGSDATYYALGAPTVNVNGVVSAINDDGAVYFSFDPIESWTPRERTILSDGTYTKSNAHSIAAHPVTGDLYTRYQGNGYLIRINAETREATLESETVSPSDSYLVFDPVNPNLLYIAYDQISCIGLYNLETKEHTIFAGAAGQAGWMDGRLKEARFRNPSQMIVAPNGNLYVADRANHCIREIVLPDENGEGGMVRTIIGKGGVAGYQDGNPDDALFNDPRGVAVLPDGTIYIADRGNNVVRKLTQE
ncbi:MAG: IPT/TIG domain-containing protein [Bacteroidales bacterium]|nr:IPT/TIG domain-containing protein [Bacteroidales bacterium]